MSDAPAWWIAQANTLASLRGWSPFVGLQIEYSLIERTVESELIPMAKALQIGVTAWSPLSGGILTGKYNGPTKEDGRFSSEMMQSFLPEQERQERVVAAVRKISEETGSSLAQVVIPIIGARKLSQSQDNLASLTMSLTPDQVRRLDKASHVPLGFPHEFYGKEMVRNLIFGGLRDRILA